MTLSGDKCISIVNHPIVKVEENKKKEKFKNAEKKSYKIIDIDGCLITDGQRCDELVSDQETSSILVKLKGTDVSQTCNQLFSTAASGTVKPHLTGNIGFLVVCSRYPRFDSFVAKAKQKAAKQYKAGFHIVTGDDELDIQRVAAIDGPK